jgi:hypothetical protein
MDSTHLKLKYIMIKWWIYEYVTMNLFSFLGITSKTIFFLEDDIHVS